MSDNERLEEIEYHLAHTESCTTYYASMRWNDLVWCVGEIKHLRGELDHMCKLYWDLEAAFR